MQTPVVELKDLEKTFRTSKDVVRAVRGIELTIHAGELVALLVALRRASCLPSCAAPPGAGARVVLGGRAAPHRALGLRCGGGGCCPPLSAFPSCRWGCWVIWCQ